jgi:pimeloyl-ACP methyl ester carboxylesterase
MSGKRGGVVLLHGLGRSGGSMLWLARTLSKLGYKTLAPSYSGRRRSLDGIIADLNPKIGAFATAVDGPVHFVTHSLGGLVIRAYLARHRPDNLGKVVMLAPPNGGSEWADLLVKSRIDRAILGQMGEYLVTNRTARAEAMLGKADYAVGVIAGNRSIDPLFPRFLMPKPNDGKVTVAATRLPGLTDHLVLPVTHTFMVLNRAVHAQVNAFFENGQFKQ